MFRLDVAALKTVSDAVKSRKPEIDDKFLSVRDENFRSWTVKAGSGLRKRKMIIAG